MLLDKWYQPYDNKKILWILIYKKWKYTCYLGDSYLEQQWEIHDDVLVAENTTLDGLIKKLISENRISNGKNWIIIIFIKIWY